jgi:hypothetical protein
MSDTEIRALRRYANEVAGNAVLTINEMHKTRRDRGIDRTDDETYKAIQMVRQITREIDYALNRFLATACSKRRKK